GTNGRFSYSPGGVWAEPWTRQKQRGELGSQNLATNLLFLLQPFGLRPGTVTPRLVAAEIEPGEGEADDHRLIEQVVQLIRRHCGERNLCNLAHLATGLQLV